VSAQNISSIATVAQHAAGAAPVILHAAETDVDAIVRELFDGSGAVTIRGLFSPEEIAQAREVVMRESESSAPKVTHFQGAAGKAGTINLQRRVWNLLAKGEVFSRMAK